MTRVSTCQRLCRGPYIKDVGSPKGGRGRNWAKFAGNYFAKTANMGEEGVKNGGKFAHIFYVRSLALLLSSVQWRRNLIDNVVNCPFTLFLPFIKKVPLQPTIRVVQT